MMELEYVKGISALFLLVVTFLSTMLPLLVFRRRRPSEDGEELRIVSFLTCFAAGVFLGTCLLHLFPDVQEQMDHIFKELDIVPNYPVAEFLFGFGFLTILIVEQIIINCQEHSYSPPLLEEEEDTAPILAPRENTSLTSGHPTNYGSIHARDGDRQSDPPVPSLVRRRRSPSTLRSLLLVLALSLHSVFEGLAIGLQTSPQSEIRILIAVLIHKCVIAFSLGLNLTSSQLRSVSVVRSNLFFSLTSPVGVLIGLVVVDFVHGLTMVVTSGILQGLAAGTFLYITLFEVLPRELACGKDRMVKMACVVLGYSVVSLLLTFLPE